MSELRTRSFAVDLKKGRTAVIATQNPVLMPDERGGLTPEILLMDGLKLPEDRTVSLLDSHKRESINDIKGLLRNLRVVNGELLGDPDIDEGEEDAVRKVEKGYVRRMSAGYYVDKFETVERGKTRSFEWDEEANEDEDKDDQDRKARKGDEDCDCQEDEDCDCDDQDRCEEEKDERSAQKLVHRVLEVKGPARVATSWRLSEGSFVALPADDDAKIRSENIDTQTADVSVTEPVIETTRRTMTEEIKTETPPVAVDEKAIAERAVKEYNAFRASVRKQCEPLGLRDSVDEICEAVPNMDLGEAAKLIVNRMATSQKKPEHVINVGEDERAKSRKFAQDLLKYRTISTLRQNASPSTNKSVYDEETPKGDFSKYSRWGYREIARLLMESNGINCRDLSGNEILERSWFQRDGVGSPVVTPGTLPSIFLDAVNVTLAIQYRAAQTTFDIVGRFCEPFVGMFPVHIQRLSNINSLDPWPVGTDPKNKKLYDAPSTAIPVNYGNNVTIDYGSILADRLDFIATIPASLAWAAKRTINQNFWALISGNQVVQEDNKALFDSSHNNTASNQSDPNLQLVENNAETPQVTYGVSTANVSKLRSLMRQQRGLDGSLVRFTPSFLVVPTTLETQGMQLCRSNVAPIPTMPAGVTNVFEGQLQCVVEPELDANSTAAYYLMSEPIFACAGYAYHEGQATPLIDSFIYQPNRSYVYQVAQASVVGLIDSRPISKYIGT